MTAPMTEEPWAWLPATINHWKILARVQVAAAGFLVVLGLVGARVTLWAAVAAFTGAAIEAVFAGCSYRFRRNLIELREHVR